MTAFICGLSSSLLALVLAIAYLSLVFLAPEAQDLGVALATLSVVFAFHANLWVVADAIGLSWREVGEVISGSRGRD